MDKAYCDHVPAREPDVNVAADRIGNSLDRLEETVSRMENRLVPVIAPEAQTGVGGPASISPPGNCSVSAMIYSASQRMGSATARLRELLDRLEI